MFINKHEHIKKEYWHIKKLTLYTNLNNFFDKYSKNYLFTYYLFTCLFSIENILNNYDKSPDNTYLRNNSLARMAVDFLLIDEYWKLTKLNNVISINF